MEDVVDSKDCREYARRCVEIANATAPYGAQSTLRELARSWIKIADQLDENGGFRRSERAMDSGKHDRAFAPRQGPPAAPVGEGVADAVGVGVTSSER
jgi:hypothetical protein